MDDATRRYLLPKRVQPLGVPYTIDKAKILDLTKQMFDTPLTGTLQHAFESYVAECMNHIAARAYDEQFKPPPTQQTSHDKLMLPSSKNLDFFVVRKKYKYPNNAEKHVPT
jgi:hypothetical protein